MDRIICQPHLPTYVPICKLLAWCLRMGSPDTLIRFGVRPKLKVARSWSIGAGGCMPLAMRQKLAVVGNLSQCSNRG